MSNEDDWSSNLLQSHSISLTIPSSFGSGTRIIFFPLIHQTDQKIFGMIYYSSCGASKCSTSMYPNDMTRTLGTSCGRNSLIQIALVSGCFQLSMGSPFSPWTATILRISFQHSYIARRRQPYSAMKSSLAPLSAGCKTCKPSRPIISRSQEREIYRFE
jgi:hypothetical protein